MKHQWNDKNLPPIRASGCFEEHMRLGYAMKVTEPPSQVQHGGNSLRATPSLFPIGGLSRTFRLRLCRWSVKPFAGHAVEAES